jgi:hypothetical protein
VISSRNSVPRRFATADHPHITRLRGRAAAGVPLL